MSIEEQNSSPERPGELVCRTEHAPILIDSEYVQGPATVIVTRADRWILANREFVERLVKEGAALMGPQTLQLVVGRPDSVRYRFVRQFDEHADLYQRVDPVPEDGFAAALRKSMDAVESPARPHAAQDAAWELARQTRAVEQLRNSNVNVVQELTEDVLAKRAERLSARVGELQAVLNEVLGSFYEKGHPGYEAQRTGWVRVEKLAEWRRVAAGRPSWDQLFALIDVKLTPWQQDILADGWSYRETHGRWPAWAALPDEQRPGHKTLQAAAAELLERARACGWAE